MLDKFFSAVFDEEHEFNDIWELKLIKFATSLGDDIKPYEKHIAISSLVEDSKGNPGVKGFFTLSNLRIVWYSQTDKDINLSIGLDTINNVVLKSIPVSGYSDFKHLLTLKAVSPSQVKFEFKFIGFTEKEERIFKKVSDVFRYSPPHLGSSRRRRPSATSTRPSSWWARSSGRWRRRRRRRGTSSA